MFFTPADHGLWDTWIFPNDGRCYLFWLQDKFRSGQWDSFGLAEADDLLHWREAGTILEKAPDAEDWMGTGRTWRVEDRFLMNFSEIRGGAQAIHLAESRNLRDWTRLGPKYTVSADPRWYITQSAETPERWVRWDLLCPVPLSHGGYIGFVTANAKHAPTGASAVVGAVESKDGIRWTGAPPASRRTEPVAEVSGYAQFGARHYVFVHIGEYMGPHYDRFSSGAQGNGMWYWCSQRTEGPYSPPSHDNLLHGQRSSDFSTFFGTAFHFQGRWLWNHHWIDTRGLKRLGTLKELVEEAPWHLALHYWPGNEGLKGESALDSGLLPAPEFPQPVSGRPLCVEWKVEGNALAGFSERASGLAVLKIPGVAESGRMLTCELTIAGSSGEGAGLFVGGRTDRPAEGLALVLNPTGRATLGRTTMGASTPRLQFWESFHTKPVSNRTAHIRAILWADFVEIYVNDRLLRTLRLRAEEQFTGSVGLWIDRCRATMKGLEVWKLRH